QILSSIALAMGSVLELCGFNSSMPCLLVVGGSLGAGSINSCIRSALKQLTSEFQVIHLCLE
ncbi:glycosyltransferase, partial [Klebsiella aerogenes]|uniref:glycosyltransferase n=1 Tax=Klebsiella aerogenes TaxID=548 RepID=UPI00223264D4